MQKKLAALVENVTNDKIVSGLQVYVVGGAVRDTLLGLNAGDRDWVVVGSNPQEMTKRKFIPVGSEFPVFLHPTTKEEYALARTERKTAVGYKGFSFYTGKDVTLEQDLSRRDLTVNAIALDINANLIDPFGGIADIKAKTLKHVGTAFNEDPVRLLRLARFMARFTDFSVAPETLKLAQDLVDAGEVDALVPERIWQEITKGLKSDSPGRMFQVLNQTKALDKVMPNLNWQRSSSQELLCAAKSNLPLPSMYALLTRNSSDLVKLSLAIRANNECKDYAQLFPVLLQQIQKITSFSVDDILALLVKTDAIRKPERFLDLIAAAKCIQELNANLDLKFWLMTIQAINSIDSGAIAKAAQGNVNKIKENIYNARLHSIQQLKDYFVYPFC